MKKIIKVVFGLVFSLGFLVTANAQTDTGSMGPAPDDIVCVQVEENVFECAIKDGSGFEAEPNQQQDLFNEGTIPAPSIEEGDQNIPEDKEYSDPGMKKQDQLKEDDQKKNSQDPSSKENDLRKKDESREHNNMEGEDIYNESTGSARNIEADEPEIKVKS